MNMAATGIVREVSLTLPMAPDMEITASKTATAMAEFMRMSPDRIDEVRMAVVEACINAFEHSHSPDRTVFMTFEVLGTEADPATLRITVRDRGVGFAPEQVEEPNIREKIHNTNRRGWGLKIIRGLMDEVDVRSGADGTTVVMSKAR